MTRASLTFQTFDSPTSPDQGPPRLKRLRAEMTRAGLDGFLVPRADAHQGEYVAARDERLAWLTGFTGSAGFAAILADQAGVFIDGRYRVQVKAQVDLGHFTPVPWPETKLADWLNTALPNGGVVGFDPWLHTRSEIEKLTAGLADGIRLQPCANLVDEIWDDRPAPPKGHARAHPVAVAGKTGAEKRAEIAAALADAGQAAALLTLPDSIAWLLNIRGQDAGHNPVVQAFAILHADARVDLFTDPAKFADLADHLGPDVTLHPYDGLAAALKAAPSPLRIDKATAPSAASTIAEDAGITVSWGEDPCILPKARKTAAEIASTSEAHLRDGAAMVEFLAWLDAESPKGTLTEIDVVKSLEGFRRATNALQDISFDTISGVGANGAIVHYRVTEETNAAITGDTLLLVDSGGQYVDGTTDITRTIAIGTPLAEHRRQFTRVLQGMIGISRLRWPAGLAGRDLDAIARYPLWLQGQDYDHGTGHGVGVFLNVHEGPQRLSKISHVPLEAGMILSNEPGYYKEGAYGIRIENLIAVIPAPDLHGADDRDMLAFETLTWVPIDRRLIDASLMSADETAWINTYHRTCFEKLRARVSDDAAAWLEQSTAPL